MIIYGIGEPDLRAALEVANYAYQGNMRLGEGPEPLTVRRQDWRMRLGVEDLDGPGAVGPGCLGPGGTGPHPNKR